MAKGIRSKAMRKNRSYLRKTLVEPIMKARQEKIAESIRKTMGEAEEKTTLMKLKDVLGTTKSHSQLTAVPAPAESDDDEMIVEEEIAAPQVKAKAPQIVRDKVIDRVVKGGRTIEVMKPTTRSTRSSTKK